MLPCIVGHTFKESSFSKKGKEKSELACARKDKTELDHVSLVSWLVPVMIGRPDMNFPLLAFGSRAITLLLLSA